MCSPSLAIAGVSAAVGIGQAALGYAGARRQAKQQAAFQAQAAAAERQRFIQEQTSIRMRQAQEQEAVGRELEQVSRKSREALARARVSAGEAGVAGYSVDLNKLHKGVDESFDVMIPTDALEILGTDLNR